MAKQKKPRSTPSARREQNERRLAHFMSYVYDLGVCLKLCDLYSQESQKQTWVDPADELRTAVVQTMVITYWRPFGENRDKDNRKHRLPESFVKGYPTQDFRSLHWHLDLVRNQLIAHSDQALRNA